MDSSCRIIYIIYAPYTILSIATLLPQFAGSLLIFVDLAGLSGRHDDAYFAFAFITIFLTFFFKVVGFVGFCIMAFRERPIQDWIGSLESRTAAMM